MSFLHRRLHKALNRWLDEDERVERCVEGQRDGRSGLLVLTDRRMLWLQERLLGVRVQEARLEDVDLVRVLAQGHTCRLVVRAHDRNLSIDGVRTREATQLRDLVARLREGPLLHEREAVLEGGETSRLPRIARLERLGQMTPEEARWARGR